MAWAFSECAVTTVASMSTVTSFPPAPGEASPASAQARSRAAARTARIAFSARGASAASRAISRETTGSEATGPDRPGCERSTAISARQSPPRATATARSAMTFPGSWTARGACHRCSPADSCRSRPVTFRTLVSRTAPDWEMIPVPSADTRIFGRAAVRFTWKVPLELAWNGP